MSRDARVSMNWADGKYEFRLAIGQLRELQEKCDAGPPVILQRLSTSQWRVDDIHETIRLGLIGGGLAPAKALVLTTRYVAERPWGENAPFAQAIMLAAIIGCEEDSPGKPEGVEAPAMDESPSPPSTEQAPQSDSPHAK